jgi:uncharacterized Zn finger protein
MTDTESELNCVDDPCPHCGENRVDSLVWLDEETVQCASCGRLYRPGSWNQAPEQEQ